MYFSLMTIRLHLTVNWLVSTIYIENMYITARPQAAKRPKKAKKTALMDGNKLASKAITRSFIADDATDNQYAVV